MLSNIGTRLKSIRKEKGITLQELSAKTDLSIGLLSNVERDLRSPTIINFHKICNALGITINEVLEQTEEKLCVKKEERKVVFSKESNDAKVSYSVITAGERMLNGMCMTVKDNILHQSYKHTSDEMGIIVSGAMVMEVGGETYTLTEGDTIYVPEGYDHSFKKISDGDCISYWISSNPEGVLGHLHGRKENK